MAFSKICVFLKDCPTIIWPKFGVHGLGVKKKFQISVKRVKMEFFGFGPNSARRQSGT